MYQYGNSIGDLENQISYVIDEISSDSTMYDIVVNATNINTVSDYILVHYENPSDQSLAVKEKRRDYSTQIYNQYAGTTPVEPVNPRPPSPFSPIPDAKRSDDAKMPLWMMLRNRRC
jgi:hypothetical protein